jgi:hypothetical protein
MHMAWADVNNSNAARTDIVLVAPAQASAAGRGDPFRSQRQQSERTPRQFALFRPPRSEVLDSLVGCD